MFTVHSLGEFVSVVADVQQRWTDKSDGFIYPWFRGMPDEDFSLLPSLYRNDQEDNEDSYRHDFQQKGYPFLSDTAYGVPISDWEWYFLMQHYGLPTRLLDWTEGSLIALFFALTYEPNKKENPCVWMLEPFKFNLLNHRTDEIFVYSEQVIKPFLPPIWSHKRLPKKPVAIQPALKSRRIAVQRGCFTLHGGDPTPIEKLKGIKPCLEQIVIDRDDADDIMYQLFISGITESLLFPELQGLSKELKLYYKKSPS
jgi:hypothetical protein